MAEARVELDRALRRIDATRDGFQRPHSLVTDYHGRERRQRNWCRDCDAVTEGPELPALPCPGVAS